MWEINRTKPAFICCSVVASMLVVLFCMTPSLAQEKYKQEYTIPGKYRTYVTQNTLDVQDIPGHQIRIYELHFE